MTRARSLSYLLWSLLAVGCGDDGTDQIGQLTDAPLAPDASSPDAPSPDDAPPPTPDAPGGPAFSIGELPALQTTCGESETPAVDLTIRNIGGEPLVISEPTITGEFTLLTELPLTIAPGASAALSVRPPTAVIGTDRGGTFKSGVLTVTTNEADSPTRTIELSATVMGANLDFTDEAGEPITVEFTTNEGACPAPLTVFLHNSGNLPLEIGGPAAASSTSVAHYDYGGFAGATIAAGGVVTHTVQPRPTGACSGLDTILYNVNASVVCTPTSRRGDQRVVERPARFTIFGDQDSCSCAN
jgi:hypothetical protein